MTYEEAVQEFMIITQAEIQKNEFQQDVSGARAVPKSRFLMFEKYQKFLLRKANIFGPAADLDEETQDRRNDFVSIINAESN